MKSIVKLLTAIMQWLANRNNPEAIEERKEKKTEAFKDDVDKATTGRDEDGVNRHLNQILCLVVLFAVCCSGCAAHKRTVYIHDSEKVVFHELNGKPGWWVPESIFGRMMNKLAEAKAKEE